MPSVRRCLREAAGAPRASPAACSAAAATCATPTSRARAPKVRLTVEIHDTVLIAAAFCMFNRYVDGLAALDAHRSRRLPRACAVRRRARLRGRRAVVALADGRRRRRPRSPGRTGTRRSVAARFASTKSPSTCAGSSTISTRGSTARSRRRGTVRVAGGRGAAPEGESRGVRRRHRRHLRDRAERRLSRPHRHREVRDRRRPAHALARVPGGAVARVGHRVPARLLHARRDGHPTGRATSDRSATRARSSTRSATATCCTSPSV